MHSNACVRRLIIFFFVSSPFIYVVLVYNEHMAFPAALEEILNVQANHNDSCVLPRLNPWDPSIVKFISHPRSIKCTHVQSDLTFLDENGFIHINSTAIAPNSDSEEFLQNLQCFYRFCESHFPGANDKIMFGDNHELTLHSPVPMTADCAEVQCTHDSELVYYNIHMFPSNDSVTHGDILETNDTQLSVLLFVLDSVSASAAKRNLPSTLEYLTKVMQVKELTGYTRVGHNTFPNLIPALTGKRVQNQQADMLDEFDGMYNHTFDHWDIVWEHFARRGYATGYAAETTKYALFHFLENGFMQKPVHHFYYPAWYLLYTKMRTHSTWHCMGNAPTLKVYLDLTVQHMKHYKGRRYFLFQEYMELTHDDENEVEKGDELLLNFFQKIFESGLLDDTILIFMSDHGIRYGSIRATDVGRMEECMPFFSIFFPQWFYRKYPGVARNLDHNRNKLSSHFDTHELLLDIAYGRYDERGAQNDSRRGISQLQPLPQHRSCLEAGIPYKYCPCLARTALNVSNLLVLSAAEYFVEHLNELLKDFRLKCHWLTLENIVQAEKVQAGAVKESPEFTVNLQLTVRVRPSNGVFEGLVQFHVIRRNFAVVGDINRINRYGTQPACIMDDESNVVRYIRQFCYCYNYLQV